MQTISFSSEIGVNEGYSADNKKGVNIENVGEILQNVALKTQQETGIYISTVIKGPNRTCYNTDWGCPQGGEFTYTVEGLANPAFTPSNTEWKIAALKFMNEVRSELKQTTVSVTFNDPTIQGVDFYYLDDDNAINNCINEVQSHEETKIDDILN